MTKFVEADAETAALSWFGTLGYAGLNGTEIAGGGLSAEHFGHDIFI
jgi:hypothetical protein